MDTVVMGTFIGVPMLLVAALFLFARRRRRAGARAGPGALLLGNLLLTLTLASLLLLGAEVWFRWFRDTTDSFGNTRACERWYERHVHRNGQGFRYDIEYPARIREGRRRLTILGDSFAAGHGVAEVADRFANRIRAARPDLEVHVLAVAGSETGAHLGMLRTALRSGYELDTVLLAYCLNDVSDLIPGLSDEYLAAVKGMADKCSFVRHSYFLDFLDSRLRIRKFPIMRDYFGYVRDAYTGSIWAEQRARLDALRDLVEEGGGRFALVVFPFLDRLDPYPFLGAHGALGTWAAAEEVPALDLLPVYLAHREEDLTVNRFDAHPNERAHAIAADAILGFLRDGVLPE